MTRQDIVRRVLREAGNTEHFFDWSDAERLAWIITRAFELGAIKATIVAYPSRNDNPALVQRPTRKRTTRLNYFFDH